MIIALLKLIVVGWLPGAVVFRAPIADRDRRAALPAEERWFWAVILSLAISLSIVLVLAAGHRYSFERLLIADAGVAALVAGASRLRLRLGAAARPPDLALLIPVALILLGVWRFFPPAEYIIGGKDPGTYISEGIQIAQRGALVIDDPVIASVPPFARDLFFPSHGRTDYYSVRFMGFWIQDPERGTVIGQFPHLYPASIAIGYGVDGLTGARRASGVWAILGLLAVYFAGCRVVGRAAAAAGASLLALHVIEVWFARYPNAEVVMQALLFAALLANARAHVDGDPFFAPATAALLALLLFLRFDAVLGVAAIAAAIALLVFTGGRLRASFVAVLLLGTGAAAAYLTGPMRGYAALPIVFVSNLTWWQYLLLLLGSGAAFGALALGARFATLSAAVRRTVPVALASLLIAGAVYAQFFREPVGKIAVHDAYALRTFTGFYLTLPALLAALAGYALGARRAFWRSPALFLTVAVFSGFFFYKIRITPDHFWMARRFLPVILPGALLFAGALAFSGTWTGTRRARLMRGAIGLAFIAILASQYVRAAAPVLSHVEYAGVIPELETLAGRIGDNDLLIVESRDASDTHVLALPLAYIYARNVLVLSSRLPDKTAFAGFLEWAATRYARVLFIGGGGTDLVSPLWRVTPLATERFEIPEYDSPLNAYPRYVKHKKFAFSIYAFGPAAADDRDAGFDLDVGGHDDVSVLRFHAKEESDGRSFRWSRDTSYVAITGIRPVSRELTIWMNDGGRPAAAPPAEVTAWLANERLGSVTVTTGFRPYTFAIPSALAGRLAATGQPAQLKLTTTVWEPERVLGTPDNRDLGVMVDRVAVK